jgi:hypothetical protein
MAGMAMKCGMSIAKINGLLIFALVRMIGGDSSVCEHGRGFTQTEFRMGLLAFRLLLPIISSGFWYK